MTEIKYNYMEKLIEKKKRLGKNKVHANHNSNFLSYRVFNPNLFFTILKLFLNFYPYTIFRIFRILRMIFV